jgi:uncharacterized protein YneF (UPF0154 family)
VIADIPQAVLTSPVSFLFGVIVGFVLSNRYRIVRRNGHEPPG